MAMKTVIRNMLLKGGILSVQLQAAYYQSVNETPQKITLQTGKLGYEYDGEVIVNAKINEDGNEYGI